MHVSISRKLEHLNNYFKNKFSMHLCEMYLKIIRYTFMNVSVATIEAPKGKNVKGMMDYVEDGVHISSFFYCVIFK